jgi:multiple sugar transport system permease protein
MRIPPPFTVLAIAPFALFMVVFGIYPVVQLVHMAISEVGLQQGGFTFEFTGLRNLSKIISDENTLPVVLATVVFVVGAVGLTVVLGTAMAILLDRASFFQRFARRVLIWPTVIAPVVVSVIWLLILSPTIGVLNTLLTAAGLPAQGWLGQPVGAMASILLVDVWHWTPLVFLLVYTSLQSIDAEVLEAAAVDGASEWQQISKIVLPMIRPAIIAAAMVRLVMSVKAFDEMYLLTHGGPGNATNLVSLHIRTVFFDQLQLGYGAALGLAVILAYAVIGIVLAIVRVLGRRTENTHA